MEENENMTPELEEEVQDQGDAFMDGWDDDVPAGGEADQPGAEDDDEASEPSRAAG